MNVEKLNKCIMEMDTLSRVLLNYDDASLSLLFHCRDGGQYENVLLCIRLEDPYAYHLPFAQYGEFKVEVLEPLRARGFIPDEYHESNLNALRIHIKGMSEKYYCSFSGLTWFVEGPQALNEHELCKSL